MPRVISSEQMKRLDSRTINEYGIPSRTLMENAGTGCFRYLQEHHRQELAGGIALLCGYGNNGGDGFVIAYQLQAAGYPVTILEVGTGKSSEETLANRNRCLQCGIPVLTVRKDNLETEVASCLKGQKVIIDAIYGIGFRGSLEGTVADLVRLVNSLEALKVAVDIASGLNADTGLTGLAFRADVTLTMAALKTGHLIGEGKACSGRTVVIPIGIPDALWEQEQCGVLSGENDIVMPVRNRYSHKGDYGRIAVFAGSEGFTGAAFMASLAALRAGAGLVTIHSHPAQAPLYYHKPYEVMWTDIPLARDGSPDGKTLFDKLARTEVILFGPGSGTGEFTAQVLFLILRYWDKPAVLDADGLNLLSTHPEWYKYLNNKPFVLTPHWGEFCRLAGIRMEDLTREVLFHLTSFVHTHKVAVLLKSHTSIYYDGKHLIYNTTGNDGLAKGGSGDLLAGLLTSFLAQGLARDKAAQAAAWWLGKTAERLAQARKAFSILPEDILSQLFVEDGSLS